MTSDMLRTVYEKHYRRLVNFARSLGASDPETLVHDTFLRLSTKEGGELPDKINAGYIMQGIKWQYADQNKKRRQEEIVFGDAETDFSSLDDKQKQLYKNAGKGLARWVNNLENFPEGRTLLPVIQKILGFDYQPMRGELPVYIMEQKFITLAKTYINKNQPTDELTDLIRNELIMKVNEPGFQKKDNRQPLQWLKKDGERLSDLGEMRILIDNSVDKALKKLATLDPTDLPRFDKFSRPISKDLQRASAPFVQKLGGEAAEPRPIQESRLYELLNLKSYLESLQGNDLAKGKALLLHYWVGLTLDEVGQAMSLTIDKVRGLLEKAKEEARAHVLDQ